MKLFQICRNEFKAFSDKKIKFIAIAAVIAIPLLYSFLYLKAYWDPYGNLKNYPIAIVNNDKGAAQEDELKNYGEEVVNDLREKNDVGFKFVDEQTASEGLKEDKYFAAIEIPTDFSEKIVTAKDGQPISPKLNYISNNKKNYIGTKISDAVKTKMIQELKENISTEYGEVAFNTIYELRDGLADAASGSDKLIEGTDKLYNGGTKLMQGLKDLSNNTPKLAHGVSDLYNGSRDLNNGLEEFKDKLPALTEGVPKLYNGSNELTKGLETLNSQIPILLKGTMDLNNGSTSITDGTNQLKNGIDQAALGVNKLYTGYKNILYPSVKSLHEGAGVLSKNLAEIKDEAPEFKTGAKSLTEAAKTINTNKEGLSDTMNQTSQAVSSVGKDLQAAIASNPDLAKDTNIQNALKTLEQLQDNSRKQKENIDKLFTGLTDFSEGATDFADTANNLADGLPLVVKGAENLDFALGELQESIDENNPNTLGQGLGNLNSSMSLLQNGASSLNAGAGELKVGLEQLSGQIPSLKVGVESLYEGSALVSGGLSELNTQLPTFSEGVNQLYDGSSKLENGLSQLQGQMPELVYGTKQLLVGSEELDNGLVKLRDGENELGNGLKDGVKRVEDNVKSSSKDLGIFIGKPIDVNETNMNPVNNYGSGLAPYFLPISLWLGAVFMLLIIKIKTNEYKGFSNFQLAIGKYIPYAVIGVVQAILLGVIVLLLGINPVNTLLLFGFLILSSLAFDAIIYTFINLFGIAGEGIAIILLVLQLCSDAGTFPIETLPSFFKGISRFLPFTYSVEAIRELLFSSSANMALVIRDSLITAAFGLVFIILSIVFIRKGEKVNEFLEESLAA